MRLTLRRFLVTLVVIVAALASIAAQGPRQPFSRVAVVVTPDRADWTYRSVAEVPDALIVRAPRG